MINLKSKNELSKRASNLKIYFIINMLISCFLWGWGFFTMYTIIFLFAVIISILNIMIIIELNAYIIRIELRGLEK